MYILRYNIPMKKNIRNNNVPKSITNYHLVFCPRYRRKIFLIAGVEARFKELVSQICEQNNYDILSLECGGDYCHIHVSTPSTTSPYDVLKSIKGATSIPLRKEFPALSNMPNLWTRTYFTSTTDCLPNEIVSQYVASQKRN